MIRKLLGSFWSAATRPSSMSWVITSLKPSARNSALTLVRSSRRLIRSVAASPASCRFLALARALRTLLLRGVVGLIGEQRLQLLLNGMKNDDIDLSLPPIVIEAP